MCAEEKVSLYNTMKQKIAEFQERTGGHEPSVIIVTPLFWYNFVDEFLRTKGPITPVTEVTYPQNSFRGYKIVRSDDIQDGEILVY
jgi:hypothetical protein